ncbi:hypothetical protein BD324DRAFT_18801 [Kockovaella imperatae]|uniref:Uncharacterized protein n=1 Tax=Kockovaella imperatae TaxID=4999 RepID=A0A1Y1URR4_9TREE|nr:hypothetical protein BD324DRAFT_18801 [Kockovaella imperatae]ORX40753.1 hypothetical protein BD324DRAFT_18801 [Kockovaella imperatae]
MNTVGAILSSMPADPRMAPGSLSQATATPHGPAGATAQTSGFVEAKSGDGTHVTGVSSTKPSTSTTTSSSTNQSTSPGSSLLAEAEARFSSISAGIGSFLSSGGSADGHPPVLPAGHSTTGFLTGFNPSLQPGGGLATNPLVPRPGESIDPATGKPHQAGLTRAQLEAKRAAEASGASIAASSMSGTASGSGTHLEDLSGREQAARQLTGTVPVPALAPAPALPGTRIGAPIDPAGANGTGHHSVLDDVNHGLEKVVDMLPQGLKERLAGVNDPKGKMSEAEREKRLSAQGILESARQQGGRIFQDFKESFNEDFRSSPKSDKSGAGSTGVIASVKELWTDVTGPGAGNLSKGPSGGSIRRLQRSLMI